MHPREFIAKHVKATLVNEGYPPHAVSLGVAEAERNFDKTSMFRKGKVFDECLKAARAVAKFAKMAKP